MDRRITDASQTGSDAELKFIRLKEVLSICGKSRSSVYEAIKNGAFPSPIKLSDRTSGWIKSEIPQWAAARIKATRTKNPN